jgi:hypothetical protein
MKVGKISGTGYHTEINFFLEMLVHVEFGLHHAPV